MSLEEKYIKVRENYLKKREELEHLNKSFEEQTDKITASYNLKRNLTDALIKKTKNKKFDDLTDEINKIEELDKAMGGIVKERKKLREKINTMKRELTEASQILSNMLGDLDYPNDKLKEDFKLLIASYPRLGEISEEMKMSAVMEKKWFRKKVSLNLEQIK